MAAVTLNTNRPSRAGRGKAMRISASVGRAAKSASLEDTVYKLTLTAETQGELQRLAALFKAVLDMPEAVLRHRIPLTTIVEKKQ